jgi:aspartyl-tRNA(Asn)/glutamyl-tRNA(Gln) amidotransferase subunit B
MTPATPRVGLEVHVRLATGRRLFAWSPIGDTSDPFVHAVPGTMPVLDPQAVELAGRAAIALGALVSPRSGFDRKHYVYPDLPRAYQITQQRVPFARGGHVLSADGTIGVEVERLHLEDDAGRTVYEAGQRCVDLGRAGGALLEVVTAPTLRSGHEAEAVLRELHAILVAVGATAGALADGDMRCDANVSVSAAPAEEAPRVELKNLNSFRFIAAAVDREIARQSVLVAKGASVASETRSWSGEDTVFLRAKRPTSAYGWMPEPDLPPVVVADADLARWRAAIPELPAAARRRLRAAMSDAHARALVASPALRALYDATTSAGVPSAAARRWLLGWAAAACNRGQLVVDQGALRSPSGVIVDSGWLGALCAAESSYTVAQLEQVATDALDGGVVLTDRIAALSPPTSRDAAAAVVADVVAQYPVERTAYRAGKAALFGFFMGAVRHASGGAIEPALCRALLHEVLDDHAAD